MPPFTSCFNCHALKYRLIIPLKILKITMKVRAANLVGHFPSPRPNIDDIREWAFQKWRTKAHLDIVALPNSFFLIKFCITKDL